MPIVGERTKFADVCLLMSTAGFTKVVDTNWTGLDTANYCEAIYVPCDKFVPFFMRIVARVKSNKAGTHYIDAQAFGVEVAAGSWSGSALTDVQGAWTAVTFAVDLGCSLRIKGADATDSITVFSAHLQILH